MASLVCRFRKTSDAGLFDLVDLLLDELQAVQVPSHLGQCVRRYGDPFRRAQGFKLARRPSEIGPESVHAQTGEIGLQAVEDARALLDQDLTLAPGRLASSCVI
jgi:hypothetical protein